ncbi:unnamed protein product [Haemonchus placei]|uniref:YDG domain-containing protein n=1 Tax=Haemonchus placei TaxID=6290 RepID=A0A0N4W9X5_HAEPC|nr:unnamed protein product [Haemonchus placei]
MYIGALQVTLKGKSYTEHGMPVIRFAYRGLQNGTIYRSHPKDHERRAASRFLSPNHEYLIDTENAKYFGTFQVMGGEKLPSDFEKSLIPANEEQGLTNHKIARGLSYATHLSAISS